MNKILNYIHRKLSIRVSLWVVLFATLIFIAALSFLFLQAREAVHQEAVSRATQILDKTSLQVEGILSRVEVATSMTEWLVQRHPDNPDSMFVYSRGMLANNPEFYNCSIAFEPYYFKEYGLYFSAYSRRKDGNIRTIQGGNDHYQYFYTDWYLMPQLLDQPCWTDPYMDFDAPTNTSEMVSSYCKAIKDSEGNFIGVINTSLSLNWLSETISAVKPYPNSYSIMTGRGGTYFVHPDENHPPDHFHPDHRAPGYGPCVPGTRHAARGRGHEADEPGRQQVLRLLQAPRPDRLQHGHRVPGE